MPEDHGSPSFVAQRPVLSSSTLPEGISDGFKCLKKQNKKSHHLQIDTSEWYLVPFLLLLESLHLFMNGLRENSDN